MGNLAAMIMSMDTLQLSGIGLATMGSIGLLAYGVLKKKSSKDHPVERTSALSDAALKSNKPKVDRNDDDSYTVNTQEEISQLRTRLSENSQPAQIESPSVELIESALVYDGYGSREEAGQMLREAMEQETHQKEKVRLHVIFKNYMAGEETLSELLDRYPTFLKKPISVDIEQHAGTKEQFDLFATKKANMPIEQVEQDLPENVNVDEIPSHSQTFMHSESDISEKPVQMHEEDIKFEEIKDEIPVLTESINFAEIKAESDLADQDRAEDEAAAVKNFFQEFGDLAQQIQKENAENEKNVAQPKESVYIAPVEKDVHDVWANYMSLYGGRMNLKNTFIHLDHAWGTIPGIAELQDKINHEIGKDANGNQIPWAIISVLPIKDADKK
jgi:hypothetical protein